MAEHQLPAVVTVVAGGNAEFGFADDERPMLSHERDSARRWRVRVHVTIRRGDRATHRGPSSSGYPLQLQTVQWNPAYCSCAMSSSEFQS